MAGCTYGVRPAASLSPAVPRLRRTPIRGRVGRAAQHPSQEER
jgi:hypothetical protein